MTLHTAAPATTAATADRPIATGSACRHAAGLRRGHVLRRACRRGVALGDPLQLIMQIMRAVPPRVWIFSETLADDAVQRRRGQRLRGGHRGRIALQDSRDQARLTLPREGLLARHHLVDDRAEREDVRAGVSLFPLELLGSHVLQRAEDGAFARQPRTLRRQPRHPDLATDRLQLRQPKVEELSPRPSSA